MWTDMLVLGISGSPHFWLRSLVVCLGLYGLYSLATSIIEWLRRSRITIAASTGPEEADELMAKILPWRNGEARKATRNASKWIGVLLLGAVFGWALRNQQLISNTHTYYDVEVVSVLSDREYLVHLARMKNYDWKFCQPRKLIPGQVIDITYEKNFLLDCKSLAGPNAIYIHKEIVND